MPKHLKEKFRELRIDEKGNLDREEIKEALKQLRTPATDDQIEVFLQLADKDKDGTISFQEFREFVLGRRATLRQLFDEIDHQRDGLLDVDEVLTAFEQLGMKTTRVQVETVLELLDTDHDGKIDFEDFVDFLVVLPSVSREQVFSYWQRRSSVDIGEVVTFSEKAKGWTAWRYLVAGGVAGAVSRTATAPLDRLKLLLQVRQTSHKGSLAKLVGKIYSSEGVAGFWRGNGANVTKIIPEAAVRYAAFEYFKTIVGGDAHELQNHERLLAGGAAGIVSQLAIYPLEVVRTRLAVSKVGTYNGIVDALLKTGRNEGIRGMYRGLMPALSGIFPYAAIELGTYDILKSTYCRLYETTDPGTATLLACGATASLCGQLVAYPLDLTRRRLQAQGVPGVKGAKYRGAIDCLTSVIKYEGFFGLYGGMGPNILKVVPAVSISWLIYERMKKTLSI